jgi:5-methyltetrahydropteroyltriglutamate--homocysteine methyltransferase
MLLKLFQRSPKSNFITVCNIIFSMQTLVDDVGSFPLPKSVERKNFEKAYAMAREWAAEGRDFKENDFLFKNFYMVVAASFKMKCEAGLDVVNYPQHYDICRQFTEVIHKAMEKGTYIVEKKDAVIPEVYVISREAKKLCEELRKDKIALRVCVTGPLELYLKEIGATAYRDVLLMFAETTRRFAENSLLNSKHVKTEVVSLDEPSFGFRDVAAEKDVVIDVLEKAFNFSGVVKQIHVHSPSRIAEILEVKNIDVVSVEYAASPRNLEGISKSMLEKANKQIRVGIARTDIDAILAELYEKGLREPQIWQIVEDENIIMGRFEKAKAKFEDRLTFTGPDCGLGGWPTQEAAQLLLKRTVDAVKAAGH